MEGKIIHKIIDLSQHLFWDVDREVHQWERNKKFIIQRVLEYGHENDWQVIKSVYGLNEIKKVAISLRSLDEVAMHFISKITNTQLSTFRCYNTRQSTKNFSGY